MRSARAERRRASPTSAAVLAHLGTAEVRAAASLELAALAEHARVAARRYNARTATRPREHARRRRSGRASRDHMAARRGSRFSRRQRRAREVAAAPRSLFLAFIASTHAGSSRPCWPSRWRRRERGWSATGGRARSL